MLKKTITFCVAAVLFLASVAHGGPQESANSSLRKFDEFGNINCEDELARLDSFAIELQNRSNLRGYIIIYGGRRGLRNEAKARAARMKYYLVHSRGLDKTRTITLDGGYRESLMGELWLSQSGTPAPTPTPTVRAMDVTLKGRVRVYGYNCGDAMGRL
jgi:hypothetical protein